MRVINHFYVTQGAQLSLSPGPKLTSGLCLFIGLGCVSQKQLCLQVPSLPIEFNGTNDHS